LKNNRSAKQNRRHVAEKACFFLFLGVLHRFLSDQTQSFRLCLGMRRYRKDRLWQQVVEVTKLSPEAIRGSLA